MQRGTCRSLDASFGKAARLEQPLRPPAVIRAMGADATGQSFMGEPREEFSHYLK